MLKKCHVVFNNHYYLFSASLNIICSNCVNVCVYICMCFVNIYSIYIYIVHYIYILYILYYYLYIILLYIYISGLTEFCDFVRRYCLT